MGLMQISSYTVLLYLSLQVPAALAHEALSGHNQPNAVVMGFSIFAVILVLFLIIGVINNFRITCLYRSLMKEPNPTNHDNVRLQAIVARLDSSNVNVNYTNNSNSYYNGSNANNYSMSQQASGPALIPIASQRQISFPTEPPGYQAPPSYWDCVV